MLQLHRVWIWSRDTMRRIIADIDTDGNGEIDWEERFSCNMSSARAYSMLFQLLCYMRLGRWITMDSRL